MRMPIRTQTIPIRPISLKGSPPVISRLSNTIRLSLRRLYPWHHSRVDDVPTHHVGDAFGGTHRRISRNGFAHDASATPARRSAAWPENWSSQVLWVCRTGDSPVEHTLGAESPERAVFLRPVGTDHHIKLRMITQMSSSLGNSSGGCCRSSSIVITMLPTALVKPVSVARNCPTLASMS